MDSAEFVKHCSDMGSYITNYQKTLPDKRPSPDVQPGFLKYQLPTQAPSEPESWEDIMQDFDNKLLPGMTHWQHPRYHSYFPSGQSYPSMLGELLTSGMGGLPVSWAACPSMEELEKAVVNWVGQMMGLPKEFLFATDKFASLGGGVIQEGSSVCVLSALVAARTAAIKKLRKQNPSATNTEHLSKLVAYCSTESHSCVEKASNIAFVNLRILDPPADHMEMTGNIIEQAMEEDIKKGLVPFFVSTTLGTTSCVFFDRLSEIGPVCKKYNAWFHVDAAYAGNIFICPEFQYLMNGIEFADSFNVSLSKGLLINFGSAMMWVRNKRVLNEALTVEPHYLKHTNEKDTVEYRHWGVELSRRCRALKVWCTIRSFGVSGLQAHVRNLYQKAKRFEALVKADPRFEVFAKVQTGLVVFCLKAGSVPTETLLQTINSEGKLEVSGTEVNGKYLIRLCFGRLNTTNEIVDFDWAEISRAATKVLTLADSKSFVKVEKKNQLQLRFNVFNGVSDLELNRGR